MKKLKRTYILGAVLFILLIVLSIQLVIFTKSSGVHVKSYILSFKETYLSGKKSSAELYIEEQKVKIKFEITDRDRLGALEFSRKLGAGENWMEGISLDLDQETRNKLAQILPVVLTLKFEGESLKFKSVQNSFVGQLKSRALQSAISKSDFEFATGSGRVVLKTQSERDFSLDIKDPSPLLKYATESGQIYLSKKVYGMFPIAGNIARIELNVSGKNFSGGIVLK